MNHHGIVLPVDHRSVYRPGMAGASDSKKSIIPAAIQPFFAGLGMQAPPIALNAAARRKLETTVAGSAFAPRIQIRAQIILLASDGFGDRKIATHLSVTPRMAARWRKRYLTLGFEGLLDLSPGSGRYPKIDDELRAKVIQVAESSLSPQGKPLGSLKLAPKLGISAAAIRKILREHRQQAK